jgi:hypothetical protein
LDAFDFAADYMVAVRAYCSKDLKVTTRCTKFSDDINLLKGIGTRMATDDYISKKTTAERATWMTAEEKKMQATAMGAAPAAGKVGFSCKAAAIVAPATVGVRPTCDAANCCMGVRKILTDDEKKNETKPTNAAETCQLKTVTKVKYATTKAAFTVKSLYCYQTTLEVVADY